MYDEQQLRPTRSSMIFESDLIKTKLLARLSAQDTLTAQDVSTLCSISSSDEFESQIRRLTSQSISQSVDHRVCAFKTISEAVSALAAQEQWQISPLTLWSRYIPLAQLLVSWSRSSSCCLIGIAGPPGAGKTSLSKILVLITKIISKEDIVGMSLDDFYLSREQRLTLGHRWRAVPGTHDLDLLTSFLRQLATCRGNMAIPRYDTTAERRLAPLDLENPPRLVVFEGWFVGSSIPGYELLARSLAHLVYVDLDIDLAYAARLKREALIRARSSNRCGMSNQDVIAFWQQALLPGIRSWVLPLKEQAEILLTMDQDHMIRSTYFRRPSR